MRKGARKRRNTARRALSVLTTNDDAIREVTGHGGPIEREDESSTIVPYAADLRV
jgi:hypothetical protein